MLLTIPLVVTVFLQATQQSVAGFAQVLHEIVLVMVDDQLTVLWKE